MKRIILHNKNFSLVHKCLQTFKKNFQCLVLQHESVTVRPHPYQLMAMPHMQTEEMTLNDKAKKQDCVTPA